MKKISLLITALLIMVLQSIAQTGAGDDFSTYANTAALSPTWVGYKDPATEKFQYTLQLFKPTEAPQLLVNCSGAGIGWKSITYSFPTIDVTDAPYVSLQVFSGSSFILRIDMVDEQGRTTNKLPILKTVAADNQKFNTYVFDFTGRFAQDNGATVNSSKISKILITANPGTGYTGSLILDSVMVGSKANISSLPPPVNGIKFNQLGFITNGYKYAVINGASTTQPKFYIVKEASLTDTVYRGDLSKAKTWGYSGESVRIADFTKFKTPGKYKIVVPGIKNPSYSFTINKTVLNDLAVGSIKGFYYQRASTALPVKYAGKWKRDAGHTDMVVEIHNSAASPGRPAGSTISSPKGWYDAGDYNKYIVNSGISTYSILACYEHFPAYYDTLKLNIPESTNLIPDVLDEALWNIRWMLTMQDSDGGVYHKLTNAKFDGDLVMPSQANQKRYVVQKTTAATLDFAAVMAQASRILMNFEEQLPGLSDSCIKASVRAYEWATYNKTQYYVQSQLTNPEIETGEYGNGTKPENLTDEFSWAAAELFTTTLKPWYYTKTSISRGADIPGWPNVFTLGLISLAHNRLNIVDSLSNKNDTITIKNNILNLANTYRTEADSSAYGIPMGQGSWNFGWGSNATAANQSLVLIQAFNYTKDSTYLKAALANLDYLMGRNATGYSYVTGYGSKPSNNIHHRPSQADGVADAVPGLLVGGPNPGQQDKCFGYPSTLGALSYLDSECSYSTNEIAINWNAPLAYISGSLQSIFLGIEPEARSYKVDVVTGNKDVILKNVKINLYPNPTSSSLYIVKPFDLIESPIILDLNGNEYPTTGTWNNDTFEINTANLTNGMYLIRLQGENGAAVQKFTVIK